MIGAVIGKVTVNLDSVIAVVLGIDDGAGTVGGDAVGERLPLIQVSFRARKTTIHVRAVLHGAGRIGACRHKH